MANTLTLDRGETLRFILVPQTDGADQELDETWACKCYMKAPCGELINLAPVLKDGYFTVSYDTSDLTANTYQGDALFEDADGNRRISTKFSLYLNTSITPIT